MPNCNNHTTCESHHDHAAHADLDTADGRTKVAFAGIITALFMVAEVVGGVISGSLALLADAAHMLTDAASLGLAWLGYWFAAKAADETRSFGFGRMRVLAAFTNGLALMALSVWIIIEGIQRLASPQPVASTIMLVVAIGGLMVNIVAAYVLHGGNKDDINLSGAFWHVIGDLLGSVAAIIAAMVIMLTSWTTVDPILSILVALIVMYAGVRITRRAGHILIQGAPRDLTPAMIRSSLITHVEGVKDVSHIHSWLLTEEKPVVTLTVQTTGDMCTDDLRSAVKRYLVEEQNVYLATVETVRESESKINTLKGNADSTNDGFYSLGNKKSRKIN